MRKISSIVIHGVEHWKCTDCGIPKPRFEFREDKVRRNGITTQCRMCIRASVAKYYQANKSKIKVRSRRHSAENPEMVRASHAAYYIKNKEARLQYHREWRQKNRQKLNAASRQYRIDNTEKHSARFAVLAAVRSGELVRPCACEMCGESGRIVGHHDSYDVDRQLTVIWLCMGCHMWMHPRRPKEASDAKLRERNVRGVCALCNTQ